MSNDTVQYILRLKDEVSSTLKTIDANADAFDNKMKTIGAALGTYFAVDRIMAFGKSVIDVGGNIEQLNVAFETMLGSKQKAVQMMDEIRNFAMNTPFEMTDVASSSKQLLAFGVAQKDVISTLQSLGDVASGVSAPIGDIAYLYGTINTQGRAMTQDINQFANRGIPIWKELEKITGLSGLSLRKFVEDGKVGFDIIQQAFQNMTAAGGQFHGLMQAQSKTTVGQISNLKDAYAGLLNDIFIKTKPAIDGMVSGLASSIKWLRENKTTIEAVAVSIGFASAAWGTYALVTNASAIATAGLTAAMWLLDAAAAANPIGLMIAGLSILIGVLYNAYQKSETFRAVVAGIGAVMKGLWPILKGTGELIMGALSFNPALIKQGLSDFATGIQNAGNIAGMFAAGYTQSLEASKSTAVKEAGAGAGGTSGGKTAAAKPTTVGKGQTGSSSVTGTKTTSINITINKLVDSIKITSSNLDEATNEIQEKVARALLASLADAQRIAD